MPHPISDRWHDADPYLPWPRDRLPRKLRTRKTPDPSPNGSVTRRAEPAIIRPRD